MHCFLEWQASQYLTQNVISITPATKLYELGALFDRHDFNCFPVVDDGICAGVVTKFDFLKAFVFTTGQIVPHYSELMAHTVAGVMSKDFTFVEPETPLTRVLELMIATRARSFPVLAPGRKLAGLISRTDLTRALYAASIPAS